MSQNLGSDAAFAAYSFVLEPGADRVGFFSALLSANLAAGSRCALVSPLPAPQLIERCSRRRAAMFEAAISRQQLLILAMLGDYEKNIFRFGPARFVEELARSGLPEQSLLLVDRAESLFSLHLRELALEQLDVYQAWLQRTRTTALLFFSHAAEQGAQAAGCQAVVDHTRGSARLSCEQGVHQLWFDFWRPAEDAASGRRIFIEVAESKKSLQEIFISDDPADVVRRLTKTSR